MDGINSSSSRFGFFKIGVLPLLLLSFAPPTVVYAQTKVEYIHTDALGSPVAVTDASGNVIEREVYEPYGSPITRPGSDQPGFTGHVMDSLTNLTYMQQRYYDPQIGRFLSVDPVTAYSNPAGAFNRYWYANNNPYRFTDPDGREIKFPPGYPESFYRNAATAIRYLQSGGAAGGVSELQMRPEVVFVRMAEDRTNAQQSNYDPNTRTITWADLGAIEVTDTATGNRGLISPALGLGHEIGHGVNDLYSPDQAAKDANTKDATYRTQEERNVIEEFERPAAKRLGEPQRGDHGGKPVPVRCSIPECM